MKKVLIFCVFALSMVKGFSQSLDDINDMIDKKQYAAAKLNIDKYVAKNAGDANGWYYKGYIYNLLSRDASTAKADVYGLKEQAFEAFKRSQMIDKNDVRLKMEDYRSYLDLYLGFYDLGAQHFNASSFSDAYKSFVKAQDVENFIFTKGYTYAEVPLSKMDTSLVMNIAASALQAHDTANGVVYYKKITDAGITGKDYLMVWQYLADYYNRKNDPALAAFLVKAKAAYPQDNYWNELELANLSSGDKTAMFKKYEELFAQDPGNFNNTFNYAVELYNSQYDKGVPKTDPAVQAKLTTVLKAAIAKDPGIDATAAMSNHLYNWAADYSTEAALIKGGKGAKPEDIRKKKELEDLTTAKMNEAIPYAENVVKFYQAKDVATLNGREKMDFQQSLSNLSNIYTYRNDAKKAAEYDKIKATIKF